MRPQFMLTRMTKMKQTDIFKLTRMQTTWLLTFTSGNVPLWNTGSVSYKAQHIPPLRLYNCIPGKLNANKQTKQSKLDYTTDNNVDEFQNHAM